MSPARVFETPAAPERDPQTLVSALDALLVTAYQLSLREQELRRKVQLAHEQYQKLADRVAGGFTPEEQNVLEDIRPDEPRNWEKLDPSLKPVDVVDHLRDAGNIHPQLYDVVVAGINQSRPEAATAVDGSSSGVRSNPCIVAERARRPSLYERDFTTNGVRGGLRCPFAKSVNNDKSASGSTHDKQHAASRCEFDPIKAEQLQEHVSSAGASNRSSVARCPIRYMDDHSPEELAQFFENHKHEIPRSHAVCVTRFQRDGATMRQIDAKYGSLVNMIQGLGAKHKPLLQTEQNGSTSSPDERVEKWAEDVSSKSPHPATLSTVEEDVAEDSPSADRTGRFERPLREVRVGESPSRPWGIPVPVSHHPQSAVNSPVAPVQVSISKDVPDTPKAAGSELPSTLQPQDASPTPARPRGRCPFDHKALMQQSPGTEDAPPTVDIDSTPVPPTSAEMGGIPTAPETTNEESKQTKPSPAKTSQMVFNGPVFFGYSAEEAAALMQQLAGRPVE